MSNHMFSPHKYMYVSALVGQWVENEAGLSDSTNKGEPIPFIYNRAERMTTAEVTITSRIFIDRFHSGDNFNIFGDLITPIKRAPPAKQSNKLTSIAINSS